MTISNKKDFMTSSPGKFVLNNIIIKQTLIEQYVRLCPSKP